MKIDQQKIIFESEEDLPPLTVSLSTTDWNRTGSWKYLEPFYQDLTPPCVNACLVGNDIVTFMRLIQEGRLEEAACGVLAHNPFPATLGRVCPHPCEAPCNRKEMGGAIAIQSAERFLGDYAIEFGILPDFPELTTKPVTVVGAGPAGLAAAYFLRILGYSVTVLESDDRAGGLMWSGIPPYRLDRMVLERELDRFTMMDIKFQFGVRVGRDLTMREVLTHTSAALLAIGQTGSRPLGIPGEEHPNVIDGVELLRSIHSGVRPTLGHRVGIIGGGNTALDCARSLLRLGHSVTLLYRRSKKEMPAFADEITEAEQEGVRFEFLTAPVSLYKSEGQLLGLECIRMKLLEETDQSGRRKTAPVEGSEFTFALDSLVKATGEVLDETWIPPELMNSHHIEISNYGTSIPGLFACGDCVGNGGTVAQAIAMGREAAYAIHAYLSGTTYSAPDPLEKRNASGKVAEFAQFSTSYFHSQAGVEKHMRSPYQRSVNFSEVQLGLSASEVQHEAARCFKCGTCTMCDNCRLFCPDNAIERNPDGSGFHVRYAYCKGCLVCVEECPRAAIHLRKVEV